MQNNFTTQITFKIFFFQNLSLNYIHIKINLFAINNFKHEIRSHHCLYSVMTNVATVGHTYSTNYSTKDVYCYR